MQFYNERWHDRRQANLSAVTSDDVTSQQMLVAGAEHRYVRSTLFDEAVILLVGCDLPAALLDRSDAIEGDELFDLRQRIGHRASPYGGLVQHYGEHGRVHHVSVVQHGHIRIMLQAPTVG